jgi:putative hydrolase of the HAD superfamily
VTPVWILDVDNTLYPRDSGVFARVDARIDEFIRSRLGLEGGEVAALRSRYRDAYGITLAGLMAEHAVDPEEYLPFVHDVGVRQLLHPDPELRMALSRLPGTKVAFTNGSEAHARTVLETLGVVAEVAAVFDIAFMEYVPKPEPTGYRKLLQTLGVSAEQCWMADDWVSNLDTAQALGMETVLVGGSASPRHRHVLAAKDLIGLLESTAALD